MYICRYVYKYIYIYIYIGTSMYEYILELNSSISWEDWDDYPQLDDLGDGAH